MSYRKGSRKPQQYYVPQPAPPAPSPLPVRGYSPSPAPSVRSYERPVSVARPYSPYAEPAYEEALPPRADEYELRPGHALPLPEDPPYLPGGSDHSWAVDPTPPMSPQVPAFLPAPPSAPPSARGNIIGSPPRDPSIVFEEVERVPIFPSAPGMEEAAPPPFDVEATSVRRLITRDLACFRQYHALRVAVGDLSRIDRSAVGNVVPEVVVLRPGAASACAAQVVGALTGVELQCLSPSAISPVTWEVGLSGDEPVNLSSIENKFSDAIRHGGAPGGIRLEIAKDGVADLLVHELADETLKPSMRDIVRDWACAIIVVRHGNEDGPLPETVRELDPTGQRTMVFANSLEPDALKAELLKLDAILSRILRSKISVTITSLTSRIDDVRKELKALPAARGDAMSQLMNLVADFSGDIYGADAPRVTESSFLQQMRDEYRGLEREIKHTIPHFAPDASPAPSPSFAPRVISPRPTFIPSRASSMCSPPPRSWRGSQHGFISPQRVASPGPYVVNGSPAPAGPAPMGDGASPGVALTTPPIVTFSTVAMRLQLLRRDELPGHLPVDKLCRALIDEHARPWADIAEKRAQSIVHMLVLRVSARVDSVFGSYRDSGLPGKIMEIMRERIRVAYRAAKGAIGTLAMMETAFSVQDEEVFLTVKERWERQYSQNRRLLPGVTGVQILARAATLDAMATVSAYLELAHQRFVDGVNRAIDAHVIHALDQDIAPVIMRALKQREVEKWLEPSSEIACGRAALQDRLEALVRAREEVMLCALA